MGKYSTTADVKLGSFFRDWVVRVNGSDLIKLDRHSNLWAITLSNLALPPEKYTPLHDRSEYISIQLLDSDGRATWNIPSESLLWVNEEYRYFISESGQAAIRRYLENQFRGVFRAYMVARFSDSDSEPIRHAIGSFLADYDLPINQTMIDRLSKDWYRFRQRNRDKYQIPIFF